MIDIHRCSKSEIHEVMSFIDEQWQKGHILSNCKELMDWQHGAQDGSFNFMVARIGERICGVLGYISTINYSVNIEENIVWLALWKVVDSAPAGLGLRILDELRKQVPHIAIAVNGINASLLPVYRALGYEVAELRQYFVRNSKISISIASAPQNYCWPLPISKYDGQTWEDMSQHKLEKINPDDIESEVLIKKKPRYFIERYLNHPIYKYKVILIEDKSGKKALIATRIAKHRGAQVLRIVDFAGSMIVLKSAGFVFEKILEISGCEYADFWVYGIDEMIVRSTGMTPVDPEGEVIVPNYFEPYNHRNGRIYCAVKRKKEASGRLMIFRGDGDQDRPNSLKQDS